MLRREFLGNVLSAPALAVEFAPGARPLSSTHGTPTERDVALAPPRLTQPRSLFNVENGLVRRALAFGDEGSLKLHSFQNLRTGFDWAVPGQPADIYLEMGGTAMTGFEPGRGFEFLGRHERTLPTGALELSLAAVQKATQAKFTLFYTLSPASQVIEHRLAIENQGSKTLPPISRFDPLTFWLRGDQGTLRVYFLGDAGQDTALVTPRLSGLATLQRVTLDSTLALAGANGSAPWLILENAERREFMFVRLGWTVDWGLRLLRKNGQVLLTAGVVKSVHELEPGEKLESPSIFAGLACGELDDAVHALHDHLRSLIPPTPKNYPWITYNLWFTEPGDMAEELKKEADFAADLGVECVYHDAGWYDGADTRGSGLWGQGLGHYDELATRFPQGLGALSDYVHKNGTKFGLWVDPPTIDSSLAGRMIPVRWLAQRDGVDWSVHISLWKPDPGLKRLCLGCPEVVAYLKKSLAGVVEKWNLDWLKWDPSGSDPFGQVCNRADHGHQAGHGAYADLRGEEEIYRYLLEKFPHLVIERCRGADGLARYSRNFPVSYDECDRQQTHAIRHVVFGASYAFPGALGQSYLWDRPDPIANRPDLKPLGFLLKPHSRSYLDNLFRSAMMTGFGFGTLDGSLSQRISRWHPEAIEAAKRNISAFKKYRHLLSGDVYHLTRQSPLYVPDPGDTDQWDILEYARRDASEAVVFFFRGGAKDSARRTPVKGLRPEVEYTVSSLNSGETTRVPGRALLEGGVEVTLPEKDTSEILLLSTLHSGGEQNL